MASRWWWTPIFVLHTLLLIVLAHVRLVVAAFLRPFLHSARERAEELRRRYPELMLQALEALNVPNARVELVVLPSSGVTLETLVAAPRQVPGDPDPPLVVCLHGFPDNWNTWRPLVPALVQEGFRVACPNMRGYGRSSIPTCRKMFHVEYLARDIHDLVHELAPDKKAHIIAHDWGGMVAWFMATYYADDVIRLVVLNGPHPSIYLRLLRTKVEQLLRSWYVFSFCIPWLWENQFTLWPERIVREIQRGAKMTNLDVEFLASSWVQEGSMKAMLNYYRCIIISRWRQFLGLRREVAVPIMCPSLIVWGDHDTAMIREMADLPREWVPNFRVIYVRARHWVHLESPDYVRECVLSFLTDDTIETVEDLKSDLQGEGNEDEDEDDLVMVEME